MDGDSTSDEADTRPAPWAGVVLAGGGSTASGTPTSSSRKSTGRRSSAGSPTVSPPVPTGSSSWLAPGGQSTIRDLLAGVPADVTVLADREPDRGPLAGMAVGLDAVSERYEYGAVVAGDMPFVDPALLDYLHDRPAPEYGGTLVRNEEGWYNPTQTIYGTDTVARGYERVLAGGGGRVLDAFEGLDILTVDEHELDGAVSVETFLDVDTRESLDESRDLM